MQPKPDHGEESYRGTGRLAGRKAVITGADSGIGRAAAIAFAREGADVVLSYLPEEEADAREVVELIKQAGRVAVPMADDITDQAYCQNLIDITVERLGGIDILVNVAGKQQFVEDIADLTSSTRHRWRPTNLLPSSSTTPPPRVPSTPSASHWPSSWHPRASGSMSWPRARSGRATGRRRPTTGEVDRVRLHLPMGRPGQPAELAPAYVFLTSPESSYVNGDTLVVSGGMPSP